MDKRSASTYTEIAMVDALRLSTLQQVLGAASTLTTYIHVDNAGAVAVF